MAHLVIGGLGYVGTRIVRDLCIAGKEVVCLDQASVNPQAREIIGEEGLGRVNFVRGDVSDAVQLFGVIQDHDVDLIINTAFAMGPAAEMQPSYALRVNCTGMINVLEAARLFGLKRVVWTSALAALGKRLRDFYTEPVGDDDAIYMPDSVYGGSKTLNEVLARLYFDKFGVDSIGLRLPRIYGYSQWTGVAGVFTEFNKKVALNIPVTIVEPDFFTSYVYIEDAADVHVKACGVPTTKTRVFNVKEGEYTNRQIYETIRKIHPDAQVSLVEGISEGIRTPRMDAAGLRTELGWQAKYSLEEGLREIYNYFRKQESMSLL